MATGIVSVALRSEGHEALSRALLVVTAILWAVFAVAFLSRLLLDGGRWHGDAQGSSSLTAVAGTAVLGSRLALLGWDAAGSALLLISTILLLFLLTFVLPRRMTSRAGDRFLSVVAPQSLVVLAAQLARHQHLPWLAVASLAGFALALGLYAALVLRFDLRELATGAGDQWVAGGALAISALACGELADAGAAVRTLGDTHDALRLASLVLWALSIAWLPVLIGAEVRWPRLAYDVRRWATVFPVGMYAAMSFTVAQVSGVAWIGDFARTWTWVAVGVWAAVAFGAVRRLLSATHHGRESDGRGR